MKTVPRIFAWSPSRLFTYEECPAKAKYKFVLKMKEPDSPAAARGTMIDGSVKAFVEAPKKTPTKLIDELKSVSKHLERVRALALLNKVKCGIEIAFTSSWKVTDWFAKDTWLRVKLDLLLLPKKDEAEVIDVKSGKLRLENGSNYEAQVRVYNTAVVAAGLAKHSIAGLLFTDHNVLHRPKKNTELKLAQLPKEKRYWEERARPMLTDKLFPPRPGFYCRYCHFSKSKGGPCQY